MASRLYSSVKNKISHLIPSRKQPYEIPNKIHRTGPGGYRRLYTNIININTKKKGFKLEKYECKQFLKKFRELPGANDIEDKIMEVHENTDPNTTKPVEEGLKVLVTFLNNNSYETMTIDENNEYWKTKNNTFAGYTISKRKSKKRSNITRRRRSNRRRTSGTRRTSNRRR